MAMWVVIPLILYLAPQSYHTYRVSPSVWPQLSWYRPVKEVIFAHTLRSLGKVSEPGP